MKRSFASTIVLVSVYGIALILSVLIVATPSRAYASDGFLGGLQDLVGVRDVESVEGLESSYTSDYQPVFGVNPPDAGTNTLTSLDEDATTVDYVNTTLDSFNRVKIGNSNSSLQNGIRWLLQSTADGVQFVVIPAGLVFMWWGVRKSIQIIMSGFRKGSMSI